LCCLLKEAVTSKPRSRRAWKVSSPKKAASMVICPTVAPCSISSGAHEARPCAVC
jgi:hypothetical protein